MEEEDGNRMLYGDYSQAAESLGTVAHEADFRADEMTSMKFASFGVYF